MDTDKFYLLFEQEIQICTKLIVYNMRNFNTMYQHKIHIYILQYMKNGKKCKVVQIKVTSAYVICFLVYSEFNRSSIEIKHCVWVFAGVLPNIPIFH